MSESEIQKSINSGDLELPAVASFRSSHWDEPNVIAHLRLTKELLTVESYLHGRITSDWRERQERKVP